MAGLIAISCAEEQARYTEFYSYLLALEKPEGTVVEQFRGRLSQINKMNAIARAKELGSEWIFFVDDDQLFAPNALKKLLARNVDVITCNLLYRRPPFNPYLFERIDEEGKGYPGVLEGKTGLGVVSACGCGGLLVKTSVFEQLPSPCFDVNDIVKTEDFFFCKLLKDAKINIYYDLTVPSGHIAGVVVWPEEVSPKKWQTTLVIGSIMRLPIPSAQIVNGNIVMGEQA